MFYRRGESVTEGMDGGSLWLGRTPSLCLGPARVDNVGLLVRSFLAAAGCALLVGCGAPQLALPESSPAPAETGTPVAATGRAPIPSPVPSLGEIVWATSADPETNAPQETVTAYTPEAPRVSAFVLANNLQAGSTIDADWAYNDTSLDAFSRQVIVPAPTDQTWVSFHIDRGDAEPWPAGVYEITISLNGETAREAAVEVVAQT